ncbi:MAG: non-hydrolyzing UDP-N-acetylglucosamine 2-epimerase [Candidatus Nitrosocosmicus sp.]
MAQYKVASIVGTRPNFIKLKPIHNIFGKDIHHEIIHTGQHYDFTLSEIFFKEFKLPNPDYNLEIGSDTPGKQMGEMIRKIEKILLEKKYDLVLVYGDTNSTFAGAFSAIKANIRVAHIESGLRSFDRRMPEEINRVLTDSISHYLFASTKTASNNLKRENVFGKIYETGDLSVEVIYEAEELASSSNITKRLHLNPKKYILFTMHRAENTESDITFLSILRAFTALSDVKIVFPIHPRTKRILEKKYIYQKLENCKNLTMLPPVGYLDFIRLAKDADKIVTDSGGLQKEAYLLSVPCITIRQNTEWTETVEEGWNILTDTNSEKIVSAVRDWIPTNKTQKKIFGNGNTSKIIKEIILDELIK